MTLNGHVKQAILFGLSKETEKISTQVSLRSRLEASTNILFLSYFENRRSAFLLEGHLLDWTAKNYNDIKVQYDQNAMRYHESDLIGREMGISSIQSWLAKHLHSSILCDVFGKQRFINALNKLHPLGLRAEFYADGDKISDRDFSFLLDAD